MKWLEFELAKARADAEAHLSTKNNKWKEKLEAAKVTTVKVFHSLNKFLDIQAEFDSALYLQGIEDFKEKVRNYFSDLNLQPLESDGEEEDREVRNDRV